MERVITYIGGFNLYYGIKSRYAGQYRWLDLLRLSELFTKGSQHVEKVKYFTADILADNRKMADQRTYLYALENHCGDRLEIIKGKYLKKEILCPTHHDACRHPGFSPCKNYHHRDCDGILSTLEEKMTDVNIATSMLVDAFQDHFDTAFLISADSDLLPPIRVITQLFPQKRIIILFPPGRESYQMEHSVRQGDCRRIKEMHLRGASLPQTITTANGSVLHKPLAW